MATSYSHNNISLRYKSRLGHLPYGGCPKRGIFSPYPYAARNYPIVKIISLPADGLKTKYNDSWCKEAYNGGRKNEVDAKYD